MEPEFVKKQLKSLKVKKSTGIPGLPARILKDGSDKISELLTLLMNRSLRLHRSLTFALSTALQPA